MSDQRPEDQPDPDAAVDGGDVADPVTVEESADELAGPDGADPQVAAAVRRLDQLGELPTSQHPEVYESVHRDLQEALADASGEADADSRTDGDRQR